MNQNQRMERKNSPWHLLDRRHVNRLAGRFDEYKKLGKEYKAQLKPDRQKWADDKAGASEKALACGQAKDAYLNFRQLHVSMLVSSPIMD